MRRCRASSSACHDGDIRRRCRAPTPARRDGSIGRRYRASTSARSIRHGGHASGCARSVQDDAASGTSRCHDAARAQSCVAVRARGPVTGNTRPEIHRAVSDWACTVYWRRAVLESSTRRIVGFATATRNSLDPASVARQTIHILLTGHGGYVGRWVAEAANYGYSRRSCEGNRGGSREGGSVALRSH